MGKAKKAGAAVYDCARCNRRLKDGRWIYSTFTRKPYCYPGDRGGCDTAKNRRGRVKR